MFIGHFGLFFAVKKAAPQVSLGILFIAIQFVDIVWLWLVVFNIEKTAIVPNYTATNAFEFIYYTYRHSFLMNIVWGVIIGSGPLTLNQEHLSTLQWIFLLNCQLAIIKFVVFL